jgi:hypothetical protein
VGDDEGAGTGGGDDETGGGELGDADGDAACTADAASLPACWLVVRAPEAPEPPEAEVRIAATAATLCEPVPSTLPRPEYCAMAIKPAMTVTSRMAIRLVRQVRRPVRVWFPEPIVRKAYSRRAIGVNQIRIL